MGKLLNLSNQQKKLDTEIRFLRFKRERVVKRILKLESMRLIISNRMEEYYVFMQNKEADGSCMKTKDCVCNQCS